MARCSVCPAQCCAAVPRRLIPHAEGDVGVMAWCGVYCAVVLAPHALPWGSTMLYRTPRGGGRDRAVWSLWRGTACAPLIAMWRHHASRYRTRLGGGVLKCHRVYSLVELAPRVVPCGGAMRHWKVRRVGAWETLRPLHWESCRKGGLRPGSPCGMRCVNQVRCWVCSVVHVAARASEAK